MEYFRKSAAVLMAGFLVAATFSVSSEAAVKSVKHQTIKMKAGTRTGIQEVFAWDRNCRTVRASFKKLSSKNGRLYRVNDRFRIKKRADKKCAGKIVRG